MPTPGGRSIESHGKDRSLPAASVVILLEQELHGNSLRISVVLSERGSWTTNALPAALHTLFPMPI